MEAPKSITCRFPYDSKQLYSLHKVKVTCNKYIAVVKVQLIYSKKKSIAHSLEIWKKNLDFSLLKTFNIEIGKHEGIS